MPAQRLPWTKVWVEALEHPKFAGLSDSEAWTWVVLLLKSSQQPKRWQFASMAHAAKVSGRQQRHIQGLVSAGLLDLNDDGTLSLHDAPHWQDSSHITPAQRHSPPPNDDARVTIPDARLTHRPGMSDRDIDREGDREKDVDGERERLAGSPHRHANASTRNAGGFIGPEILKLHEEYLARSRASRPANGTNS